MKVSTWMKHERCLFPGGFSLSLAMPPTFSGVISCKASQLGFHFLSGTDSGPPLFWPYCDMSRKIGVSKNHGTPKWMVYNGNPYLLMDDLGIPLFLEPPIYRCIHSAHVNTYIFLQITYEKFTNRSGQSFSLSTWAMDGLRQHHCQVAVFDPYPPTQLWYPRRSQTLVVAWW